MHYFPLKVWRSQRKNAISLPCLLLYSLIICGGFKTKLLLYVTSMYQRRPLKKLNKTYFDHIVALSALKSPVATKWLPPPPNWVKINFDVAIPQSSTIVVIYRNEVREDHFARSSLLPPSKPIQCEVQATILTLKLAIHRKLCFVVFEGDSKSMIKALQLCPFPPNLLSPFLHIIRLSLSFLICWDFIFVNINIKFLAHNLAQWVVHCIWDRALTISYLYAWVSFA